MPQVLIGKLHTPVKAIRVGVGFYKVHTIETDKRVATPITFIY